MSLTLEKIPAAPAPIHTDPSDLLVTVDELRRRRPLSPAGLQTVSRARREFGEILSGRNRRLVLVIGPCSIHDPASALEFGRRLLRLREDYGETFLILMRTYLEKPRTTIGWKGLISDPHLDDSCDMNRGLELGRQLLVELADIGVPSATELVDPAVTPYLEDAIAWASIGARTVESQIHRQLASGLPMPVGFKNGTQGNVRLALDAIIAARHSHVFPASGPDGRPRLTRTSGNSLTHLILRGGRVGSSCIPNWMPEVLAETGSLLESTALPARLMVDCSHANSGYDPARQLEVADGLLQEAGRAGSPLFGLMLESHLEGGQQKLNGASGHLRPGLSVTDPCLGMRETEEWIHRAGRRLAKVG